MKLELKFIIGIVISAIILFVTVLFTVKPTKKQISKQPKYSEKAEEYEFYDEKPVPHGDDQDFDTVDTLDAKIGNQWITIKNPYFINLQGNDSQRFYNLKKIIEPYVFKKTGSTEFSLSHKNTIYPIKLTAQNIKLRLSRIIKEKDGDLVVNI